MIRWPGRVAAGRVSDEIVHGVDLFPTIARLTEASVPNDRPIEGVDQSTFFLGKTDTSAREGIPIWCADRLQAVKWRHYKVHFYQQDTMVSPPVRLSVPLLFNLYTNPREDEDKPALDTWVVGPVLKIVAAFEESVKKYPLIPMGTPIRIGLPPARDDARRRSELSARPDLEKETKLLERTRFGDFEFKNGYHLLILSDGCPSTRPRRELAQPLRGNTICRLRCHVFVTARLREA